MGDAHMHVEGAYSTPEGTFIEVVTHASNPDDADRLREHMQEAHGWESVTPKSRNGRSFGMTGNWSGSKWEPTGPQRLPKNRGPIPPPADLSSN